MIHPKYVDNFGLIVYGVTNAPVSDTNPPKLFSFPLSGNRGGVGFRQEHEWLKRLGF